MVHLFLSQELFCPPLCVVDQNFVGVFVYAEKSPNYSTFKKLVFQPESGMDSFEEE